MTALVEDLLLLARLDAGRPLDHEPVDLTAMVVNAVSDAHAASPDHVWQLDLPDEPVEVPGDPARLHQIVANLLANARTHTPPGTVVGRAASPSTARSRLSVATTAPGSRGAAARRLRAVRPRRHLTHPGRRQHRARPVHRRGRRRRPTAAGSPRQRARRDDVLGAAPRDLTAAPGAGAPLARSLRQASAHRSPAPGGQERGQRGGVHGRGPARRSSSRAECIASWARRRRRSGCRAGRGDRADGRAAGHVGAVTKRCSGTPACSHASANAAAAGGVGGVAQVGVDLEDRPAVDARSGARARGARRSWGGWRGPCRRTRRPSRPAPGAGPRGSPPAASTIRSSTVSQQRRLRRPGRRRCRPPRGRTAPATGTVLGAGRAGCSSAVVPAQQEHRLSSRGALTSSPSQPDHAGRA